ncbi:MAG: RNA methyltransferase [Candidatus Latescibacteria bacterium]|nr:RNA methyltransferase [Candidatus Latescibacterota bacterium]
MARIASLQNPLIKMIRSLNQRKHREQEGMFFAEGIRVVEEAVAAGVPVERVIYAPERLRSDRAMGTVRALEGGGAEVVEVSDRVFDALSGREEGQGIGAVIRIPERTLEDIPAGPEALVAVLVEPRDPGNLGSILRTADCAGASGVVVVGTSADLYDPKCVRASMGSLFAAVAVSVPDLGTCLAWARSQGLRCVATSARAERSCFAFGLTGPLALILGPERGGLDEGAVGQCDALVRVPMRGRASSLNLASAAAVLMYEAVRQRMEEKR